MYKDDFRQQLDCSQPHSQAGSAENKAELTFFVGGLSVVLLCWWVRGSKCKLRFLPRKHCFELGFKYSLTGTECNFVQYSTVPILLFCYGHKLGPAWALGGFRYAHRHIQCIAIIIIVIFWLEIKDACLPSPTLSQKYAWWNVSFFFCPGVSDHHCILKCIVSSCYFFIKIIPYGLGSCHRHYYPPYSHEHWACQGWAKGGWWVLGCARFRYVWTCPLCPPNSNHTCTQPHKMGTGVRVIWRLIWRHTVEKSQTNVPCPLTQPNPTQPPT